MPDILSLTLNQLSKALNAFLDLDPNTAHRLAKLKDNVIAITLLPFNLNFYLTCGPEGLSVLKETSIEPISFIKGTPLQLAAVLFSQKNRQRFFAEDVTIEGNAEIANEIIALFDKLKIDWEDILSNFIGDIPTFYAAKNLQSLRRFLKQAKNSLLDDLNEYIHEEKYWLPSKLALADFFQDIDEVRLDVDRAQAKMASIKLQLEDKEP